jgi:hypothetical protein
MMKKHVVPTPLSGIRVGKRREKLYIFCKKELGGVKRGFKVVKHGLCEAVAGIVSILYLNINDWKLPRHS